MSNGNFPNMSKYIDFFSEIVKRVYVKDGGNRFLTPYGAKWIMSNYGKVAVSCQIHKSITSDIYCEIYTLTNGIHRDYYLAPAGYNNDLKAIVRHIQYFDGVNLRMDDNGIMKKSARNTK